MQMFEVWQAFPHSLHDTYASFRETTNFEL